VDTSRDQILAYTVTEATSGPAEMFIWTVSKWLHAYGLKQPATGENKKSFLFGNTLF
jgi:hypothetical protein